MADTKTCDACGMDYDWQGVNVGSYEYCCEACSQGEECTCPQHNHQYGQQTGQEAPTLAGAGPMGASQR